MKKSSVAYKILILLSIVIAVNALVFLTIEIYFMQESNKGACKLIDAGPEYYVMNISEDGKLRLVVFEDHEYLSYKEGLTHSHNCGCFLRPKTTVSQDTIRVQPIGIGWHGGEIDLVIID